MTSPARRLRRTALGALAAVLAGLALAACAKPTMAPRLALEDFLTDVQSHATVYAYTEMTNAAEGETPFLPFAAGVNASTASFRVLDVEMVNSSEAIATVEVSSSGRPPARVKVQMLEEGNAGDWLVGAPFTSQGAKAIRLFQ